MLQASGWVPSWENRFGLFGWCPDEHYTTEHKGPALLWPAVWPSFRDSKTWGLKVWSQS